MNIESMVSDLTPLTLADGNNAEALSLKGGVVLLLHASAIASYKSLADINNPLTNGRIDYADIAAQQQLQQQNNSFVVSHRSGLVQLQGEKVLIITPFHATLFANKNDALNGSNILAQVNLR